MTSETKPARIAYEDVDDVIEAAAKAKEAAVETLSVEELQEVAADLDIPRELVGPAIEQVRRRRQQALAAEQAAAKVAAERRRIATWAAAFVAVLAMGAGLWASSTIGAAHRAVQQQRAQVVNVLDRQVATERQWSTAAASSDKQAELSGAENRVRLERKRYDQKVTAYREAIDGPIASVVRWIGGYPADMPLSSEVQGW
jgi:hypothetical protein